MDPKLGVWVCKQRECQDSMSLVLSDLCVEMESEGVGNNV